MSYQNDPLIEQFLKPSVIKIYTSNLYIESKDDIDGFIRFNTPISNRAPWRSHEALINIF